MPASTTAKIGAGSCLYYEDPQTPDTFIAIAQAKSIGTIGDDGDTLLDVTPICATEREYIENELPEFGEFSIELFDKPGDADAEAFLAVVAAKTATRLRAEFSNGRIATFGVTFDRYFTGDVSLTEVQSITATGKKTTKPTWTIAA